MALGAPVHSIPPGIVAAPARAHHTGLPGHFPLRSPKPKPRHGCSGRKASRDRGRHSVIGRTGRRGNASKLPEQRIMDGWTQPMCPQSGRRSVPHVVGGSVSDAAGHHPSATCCGRNLSVREQCPSGRNGDTGLIRHALRATTGDSAPASLNHEARRAVTVVSAEMKLNARAGNLHAE